MSTNGEAADLAVREGIEVTEHAMKLVGLGAKNLAALLMAVVNDNQKVAGLTNLRRLMQDGDQKVVFSVKEDDMKTFSEKAKKLGILYVMVKNKKETTEIIEVIARASDAQMINHILESMNYPAPAKEDNGTKKAESRAPSDRSSKERGRGATEAALEKDAKRTTSDRESVKPKLEKLRAAVEERGKEQRVQEAIETAIRRGTPENIK